MVYRCVIAIKTNNKQQVVVDCREITLNKDRNVYNIYNDTNH